MIRLQKLRRTYRAPDGSTIEALNIAELELSQGESLVVTGANGSGKTTLLHVLSGLLRPDDGSIHVGGQDLSRLKEAQLDRFRAQTVGYLLQGAHLMDSLTAEENVAAAMLFCGRPRREQRRRTAELLERFGVAGRASHLPGELSGGERQRVALARALANDPPLILADEPGAALDPTGEAWLAEELGALASDEQRTLVVVTHHPRRLGLPGRTLEMAAGSFCGGSPE